MYVLQGAADFYQAQQIPLKGFDNPTIMLNFCSSYDIKYLRLRVVMLSGWWQQWTLSSFSVALNTVPRKSFKLSNIWGLNENKSIIFYIQKIRDKLAVTWWQFRKSRQAQIRVYRMSNVINAKGHVLEKHKDAELISGWMNCLSLNKK